MEPVVTTRTRCTGRFSMTCQAAVYLKDARDAACCCMGHRRLYFHCRFTVTLGETVQWPVTFAIFVHFSMAAGTTRRLRECEQ